MTGSQIWTKEEAISDVVRLLESAEHAPQYIRVNSGRLTISFQKVGDEMVDDFFSVPGPLEKDDIGDL
jgi:hypothetical protein